MWSLHQQLLGLNTESFHEQVPNANSAIGLQ